MSDQQGRALWIAAHSGKLSEVNRLLGSGASINWANQVRPQPPAAPRAPLPPPPCPRQNHSVLFAVEVEMGSSVSEAAGENQGMHRPRAVLPGRGPWLHPAGGAGASPRSDPAAFCCRGGVRGGGVRPACWAAGGNPFAVVCPLGGCVGNPPTPRSMNARRCGSRRKAAVRTLSPCCCRPALR